MTHNDVLLFTNEITEIIEVASTEEAVLVTNEVTEIIEVASTEETVVISNLRGPATFPLDPTLDAVTFNTSANYSAAVPGTVYWDAALETINVMHDNGVPLHVGHEQMFPILGKNGTGSTITNGTLVMVTGVTGNEVTIMPAITDGSVEAKYIIGVMDGDLAPHAEHGHIMSFGTVHGYDTHLWPIGTELYANPLVPGQLTDVQPDAPAFRVPIAFVIKSANNGSMIVRMSQGSALGVTDDNVKISSLTDGDVLAFNSTSGLWENNPSLSGFIMPFAQPGPLQTKVGVGRFRAPFNLHILGVSASVAIAPVGANIIIDVNKNGTTIFTTQANRPQVPAGMYEAVEQILIDDHIMNDGDYLTVDIDQIGSSVAGSYLTVFIRYQRVA